MKRGVLNAGSRVSLSRRRIPGHIAERSVASLAFRNAVEKPKRSLAERLQRLAESPRQHPIAASGEVISRTQAKTRQLLRVLDAAVMPVAPLYGDESQTSNTPSDWTPEEWKDDWGPDKLVPKKPLPPHIGLPNGSPVKPSPPKPKQKPLKRAPIAYTRKIEGLIDPSDEPVLLDVPPPSEHKPIAMLEHGLERVLFNPGVHWLQDPRSRVYNFPPHLENIPKVTDFAFERLPGFIKSSRDEDLRTLAKRQNRLFAGSTSSLTGMLGHCYFLISEHKAVNISSLSQNFQHEEKNFTPGQRMPTSVLFNYKDGIYAIDSDSEDSSKNILTWLGTLLEKFVTMSKAEFATYLRSSPPLPDRDDPMREAYRYAKSEKFVMRSQLDCVDKRLPGTGVFDIKTRACLPVRLDILNWEENSGYMIKSAQGLVESFEREYYDLIRSAFLKYGFQVRIGNMDGVIVAYHNTARIFGFQYVSLEEMDSCLFGSEPGAGDRVFQKCVTLLECIASEVVQCFPNQSVKCTFECEEGAKELNVWVQPAEWSLTDDEVDAPIRQLTIRAQSFLDESPVNGARAINSSSSMPWTLHWSLSHLSANQEEIRKNLAQCMERKFRAYSLPTGVSFEDLPQYWSGLNFGGEPKPEEPESADPQLPADFDWGKFRMPNERVQILRDLARSGREFSEMMERAEAGKRKVVLGEPYDPSDVEVEVYETEDDRDVQGDVELQPQGSFIQDTDPDPEAAAPVTEYTSDPTSATMEADTLDPAVPSATES
ncbi:mitochondrial protein Pet127-domain-containing protein [Mycena maculata]|uniref:Mitochondrial protein Pet127-domain-containing protein n=1 Tax=Mycena maculata TaxID=230809 RepID=A0AAD7NYH7_9AGAR|nr:mitochondrial protein Pet127-domain-containing protein [Mycena maculata]